MKQLISKLRSKPPAPKEAPAKDPMLDDSDLGAEEMPEAVDAAVPNPELEAIPDDVLAEELKRRGFDVAPPAEEPAAEEMPLEASEEELV